MKSLVGATLCGAALFALPFLQSGLWDSGTHVGLHMDHEPHHGGRLLMLGDHHLEIVEKTGTLELYVSDAQRRPLQPEFATIAFDSTPATPFLWSGYRMTVPRPVSYDAADYRIALPGVDAQLTIRLPRG
jgi:hypothetical protein